MTKKLTISIRLDVELNEKLEQYLISVMVKNKKRITKSELIRQLLEHSIENGGMK